MKKLIVGVVLVAVVGGLAAAGCAATRAGYQSAPYTVVRTDGHYEVRDYPTLTLVETPTAPDGNGRDGSFMRLYGYITGKNTGAQKLPMTTPVFMSSSDAHRTMSFVLPATVPAGQAPAPSESGVTVREVVGGRFAVLRFSGSRTPANEEARLSELQTWMAAQGLSILSPPMYGYFDPPWTPTFWRRNEVMLRTATSP